MLGQSGILTGKSASGPRALIPDLKKKFPTVKWVADKRWVTDGNIWTSGMHLSTELDFPNSMRVIQNVTCFVLTLT